ncbi:MAG: hypothetical protein JO302_03130 [Candidatus Eremiobacteraeota bacterium]|nr:hypothetical protein [Candidatus Eremiobacteraeota bacterium]
MTATRKPFITRSKRFASVRATLLDTGFFLATWWVTGIDRAPGGFEIWRWNGSGWDKYARNGAVSISVGPAGRLWVISNAHEIYRIDI